VKLWPRVWCLVFMTHGVEVFAAGHSRPNLVISAIRELPPKLNTLLFERFKQEVSETLPPG